MIYTAENLTLGKHAFFSKENGNIKDSGELFKNLNKIAFYFGLTKDSVFMMKQGVSNHAVYTDKPSLGIIKADGAVTDKKGIILGICTADCAPVLFEDREKGIIGVAHAGWRGAVRGIIENVVKLMLQKGAKPENIHAAIGPCLQQKNFECRQDMYVEFKGFEEYFTKKNAEQYLFDAEKFIYDRIKAAGINNISVSGIDTYEQEDNYFSYRRDTHRLEQDKKCGHFSAITL